MRIVRPFGVDLCSGVRTQGRLDADKLNAFIDAVRRADSEPADYSAGSTIRR
jgi:phosphoribosylanthranilate isomerase